MNKNLLIWNVLQTATRSPNPPLYVCHRDIGSVVRLPAIPDFHVRNEPLLDFRKSSAERALLDSYLRCTLDYSEEVPIVIGGQCIRDGEAKYQVLPHKHSHKLCKFYHASEGTIKKAIEVAACCQDCWDRVPLERRVCIFQNAATMCAGCCRMSLIAATMLGQGKTAIQAEIDICEFIDYLRFNAHFLTKLCTYQPISEKPSKVRNSLRYRGIDGFVAAITPFHFTAVAGNLAYTPTLMGNCTLWKPADQSILSNWRVFNIMRAAGIPDGVANFVPAVGSTFGKAITSSPCLAGINYGGSTATFSRLYEKVGKNIKNYNNFPRMVGECGGKNYHLVHCSADVQTVVAATIRSAFEYSGQKRSSCSRMFIPRSLAKPILDGLKKEVGSLKIGGVCDYKTFTSAVIDKKAFKRITAFIKGAQSNKNNKILVGGKTDDKKGYFIHPTVIVTTDPCDKLLREEIFGPVLVVFVYEDCDICNIVYLINTSTEYALTGSVFAQDECFLCWVLEELKMSAGNFYINDKSTGTVVGQQPYGGARMSGTNDKAGGPFYVLRWGSPQTIKETFTHQRDITYPYMKE